MASPGVSASSVVGNSVITLPGAKCPQAKPSSWTLAIRSSKGSFFVSCKRIPNCIISSIPGSGLIFLILLIINAGSAHPRLPARKPLQPVLRFSRYPGSILQHFLQKVLSYCFFLHHPTWQVHHILHPRHS